jgi:hypothetical protein
VSQFRPRGARRRPPSVPRSDVLAASRISSAIRGCTCRPDFEVSHDDLGPRCTIRHDDDCPAHPNHRRTT